MACMLLLLFTDFFKKINFFIFFSRNTIRVSNGLDTDQAGSSVGPDLGPNCLQRLSAVRQKMPLVRKEFNTKLVYNGTS